MVPLRKPIIAAAIAACFFLIYKWDRERILATNLAQVRAARVIPFDGFGATRVEIENEEGRFVIERRGPREWWLLEPVEIRADEHEVENIVDSIHAARKESMFRGENLAEYGLDNPSHVITMTGLDDSGDSHEVTLYLGDDSTRIGQVYGRASNDDNLFTMGFWVRNKIVRDLNSLRDRNLARFEPENVVRFSLLHGEDDWTITRRTLSDDSTLWWIEELDQPANQNQISRALSTLSSVRAAEVFDNTDEHPRSATGLGDPPLYFQIETEQGDVSSIRVGRAIADSDRLYVSTTNLPSVGALRASQVEWMIASRRDDWRTRRFVWAPLNDWAKVETFSGVRTLALERGDNDEWRFEDYPDLEVHQQELELFLDAVGNLAALRFESQSPDEETMRTRYGLRSEAYGVQVTTRDGKTQGFRRGSLIGSEGTVFIHRTQDDSIWSVDATRMEFVTRYRSDLQDKRIFTGFANDVARIVIEEPESGVRFEFVRGDGVWRLQTGDRRTIVLSPRVVEAFLISVENLEWDTIEMGGEMAEPARGERFTFYNAMGVELYRFIQLDTTDRTVTIQNHDGIYNVPAQNYLRMMTAWNEMVQSGRVEE